MLNQLSFQREWVGAVLICLMLSGSLFAKPRHSLPSVFTLDYNLLADFQLDTLELRVLSTLEKQVPAGEEIGLVPSLYKLAEIQIARNQFDQAYQTFLKAYQASQALDKLAPKLYLKGALSEAALLKGDLSAAIDWRTQFLAEAQYLGRCELEAWAHKRLGRLLLKDQQFDQAKFHFEEALRQYDKIGDQAMVQALRQEWGLVHLRKRNYLSAINCFATNLEEQKTRKDTLGLMSSLKQLVEIHEKLGDTEAMKDYCQQIISWAIEPQFQIWQSGAYLKLGKMEEESNNIGLAKEYYLQNQHLLLAATARPELLQTLKAKRPVYQLVGDFKLPVGNRQFMKENRVFSLLLFWIRIGAFEKVQAILDEWMEPEQGPRPTTRTIRLAYRIQTESYRNQARFPEAVQTFRKLLQDHTLAPNFDPLLSKVIDFQEEAKESHEKLLLLFENQEQQRLIEQSTWRNRSLLAGILIALMMSALLLYNNQERKRNNLLLSKKNQLIAEALEEKEMLIREVHHRVKNNLQVVSSLLNLQARKIEDPQAMGAIREGRDRVKSMAFIHQKLYQVDDVRQMAIPDYIDNLANYLFTSYQVDPQQIQLTTQIEDLDLDVDIMVPLGLMLNEMISNALKHAFPKGKRGEISVLFVEKAGSYLLEVADTGVGMPRQENRGQNGGFGYQLIQTFCKKLKGRLEIHSQQGTRIQFSFPKTALTAA